MISVWLHGILARKNRATRGECHYAWRHASRVIDFGNVIDGKKILWEGICCVTGADCKSLSVLHKYCDNDGEASALQGASCKDLRRIPQVAGQAPNPIYLEFVLV